jgi:thioesterase domain-containing protein/acyl carrier protein
MINTVEAPVIDSTAGATAEKLARIWENLLGVGAVEPGQDYFDLGGDSSLAVQMFAQIEKTFGVRLPLATLYDAPTIADLSRIIDGEATPSGWSPLVPIQPLGSRPPFFCMHGAGGNVLNYRRLSQHLGPDQPFYGLQAQGLDQTSPPLTVIAEMAALYVKHIRKAKAHGPYFLGGYCMGGTIAYEVAQQLLAAGEQIALLALFDTMNWHKIPLNIWSKSSYGCQRLMFHAASFLELDSREKTEFVKDKLDALRNRLPVWRGVLRGKLGWHVPDSGPSHAQLLGRIWRINDEAGWNYIPQPYPGTIIDFRPSKQYRVFDKPDLKWDGLAQQRVVMLPVYPATMLVEPFVRHLAGSIKAFIDQAAGLGCAPR